MGREIQDLKTGLEDIETGAIRVLPLIHNHRQTKENRAPGWQVLLYHLCAKLCIHDSPSKVLF